MQPASKLRQLDEALRDIDADTLGLVMTNGMIALTGFAPAELARSAAAEIERELAYAHRLVKLSLNGRWVSLQGEVEWSYQKRGAETAVRRMRWLKGISNELHICPRTEAAEVARRLAAAFQTRPELRSEARLRSWAA